MLPLANGCVLWSACCCCCCWLADGIRRVPVVGYFLAAGDTAVCYLLRALHRPYTDPTSSLMLAAFLASMSVMPQSTQPSHADLCACTLVAWPLAPVMCLRPAARHQDFLTCLMRLLVQHCTLRLLVQHCTGWHWRVCRLSWSVILLSVRRLVVLCDAGGLCQLCAKFEPSGVCGCYHERLHGELLEPTHTYCWLTVGLCP